MIPIAFTAEWVETQDKSIQDGMSEKDNNMHFRNLANVSSPIGNGKCMFIIALNTIQYLFIDMSPLPLRYTLPLLV